MVDKRQPSLPPSDPRQPSVGPFGVGPKPLRDEFVAGDRPTRAVLVGAVVFGLVLVATGIYLWRRPHGALDAAGDSAQGAPSASAADDAVPPPVVAETLLPAPVALSEARVLGCHDKGRGTTPPDECDHLAPIEQALARVVKQAVSCVPDASSAGTIEYVADVSFTRHRIRVTLPRAGRSVRDRKVVHACASAVRDGMQAIALDGIDHKHARYSISMTATYRGSSAVQPVAGSVPGSAAPNGATAAVPSPGSVRN
jgi:hypothetical protein